LFGKSTSDDLKQLSNEDFLSIFEGVPQAIVPRSDFENGVSIMDLLVAKSGFLSSNGEAKRELKANAIAVNKDKVAEFRKYFENYTVDFLTLEDLKLKLNIHETGKTFLENAMIKAKAVAKSVNKTVIADDSGLQIDTLTLKSR
jgi:tyrosyl-tRNA synthetase